MFHVAIPLVHTNLRSGMLEHDVALAMEPYRGKWWKYYIIVCADPLRRDNTPVQHTQKDPTPYAVIGTNGLWYSQCHVDEIDPRDNERGYTIPLEQWERELDEEFWGRLFDHSQVVRVRCKL